VCVQRPVDAGIDVPAPPDAPVVEDADVGADAPSIDASSSDVSSNDALKGDAPGGDARPVDGGSGDAPTGEASSSEASVPPDAGRSDAIPDVARDTPVEPDATDERASDAPAPVVDARTDTGVDAAGSLPDGDVPPPVYITSDRGGGCGCRVRDAERGTTDAARALLGLSALALLRRRTRHRPDV
jgi:MYXO-CTERM domain-containing protein